MPSTPPMPQPTPSSECRDAEVEDAEQEDPHHVDEVPVESHRRDSDVVLGRELAARRAVQDDQYQDQAPEHVEAVEAGHGEEGAGEGVRRQREAAAESLDELVQLAGLESEAQDDRRDPQGEESPPVVVR